MGIKEHVNLISGFGVDNIVSHVIGKEMMHQALPDFKGGDAYIVNHFLNLEGEKFSTSRRHVIWAKDLIAYTAVQSDGLRMYLATCNTTVAGQNFSIDEFATYYNHTYIEGILKKVRHLAMQITADKIADFSSPIEEKTLAAMGEIRSALQPATFDTARLCHIVETYLDGSIPASHAYWLLKSFGVVAFPAMPTLCMALWQFLGEAGSPCLTGIDRFTKPKDHFAWNYDYITTAAIKTCLPKTQIY